MLLEHYLEMAERFEGKTASHIQHLEGKMAELPFNLEDRSNFIADMRYISWFMGVIADDLEKRDTDRKKRSIHWHSLILNGLLLILVIIQLIGLFVP